MKPIVGCVPKHWAHARPSWQSRSWRLQSSAGSCPNAKLLVQPSRRDALQRAIGLDLRERPVERAGEFRRISADGDDVRVARRWPDDGLR